MNLLIATLVATALNLVVATNDDCFRAAVVDYVPRTGPLATQAPENLAIYEKIAARAAYEGARIIVFPEDAIFDSPNDQ